jgi:ADP-heptose:LPS heptosyltransferase
VQFFSLQLDDPAELPFADPVEDLAPELTAWERTAAAMMQLDLIISVDTSVAHLAGALGRPVWICLAADPEWRWMLERTDTPWYGSARLFRQPRVGDWVSVFTEVARELEQEVRARSRESA